MADIESKVVQPGQDAGLLQVVEAIGQHTGCHDDQEAAGPGEELGQVDLEGTLVEGIAHGHCHGQAECRADDGAGGRTSRRGGLGGSPEEQRRLQTLSGHGQEGDQYESKPGALGGQVNLTLEFTREALGVLGHPEDHPGDEADRDDGQDAAQGFLGLEGEAARAEGEQGTESQ